MPLRKLLIRVMLWSLGATAVIGSMTVLIVGVSDTYWRLVGTGMATAAAAGLMIPFSTLADKPKSRREGLLGMALIVIEFIGVLGLIWRIFETFGTYRLENKVALTMLFLVLTGLPAILFLRFASLPVSRIVGIAGDGLCGIVFTLLMIGVWSSSFQLFNSVEERWFDSAGALAYLGLFGVVSLAGIGAPPRRLWRWIGVGMSLLALSLALYAIWMRIQTQSAIFTCIVSVAALVAFINVCLFVPLTPQQKWLRIVTILAAAACAAMIDMKDLARDYQFNFPMAENLAAATGIIAACGSMALLVLTKINRNLDRVPVLSEIREMIIICPGCRKKQTLPIGDSTCAGCGLKISIRVEEPRCPNCDYLLFMLTSDRCPECGTIVRGLGATGISTMIEHA